MLEFMKQYFPKLLAFVVAVLIFMQVLPPDYNPFDDGDSTSVSEISEDPSNPSNWTVEQIVDYYKTAAAATKGQSGQSYEILELPSVLNLIKSTINNALSQRSVPIEGITGGYENLTASDLTNATASKSGLYVTINLTPKDQTDGIKGRAKEGTVGHVVDVIDGVGEAVGVLGVPAEYPEGSVTLEYKNAYAKNIKINTLTGRIVSGEWGYDLFVTVNGAKLAGIKLNNVKASFSYTVSYPA